MLKGLKVFYYIKIKYFLNLNLYKGSLVYYSDST